jgi:hypothetical protein
VSLECFDEWGEDLMLSHRRHIDDFSSVRPASRPSLP